MSCEPRLRLGIEVLLADPPQQLKGRRVGLITNHTGAAGNLRSGIDLLAGSPELILARLFAPEHGVRGDAQAGVHVTDSRDPRTGLTVHSLYGENKRPGPELLQELDVLVCHLQDAGSRYWTYLYTLAYCMQAAAEAGVPFVVLDRPNPLGGRRREGNLVEQEYRSFVGDYGLPMRHGLTIGEFARYLQGEYDIPVDLTVVAMEGWQRDWYFEDTGLSWIPASPNSPTVDTLVAYPGTCLVEGSNLSEGRGTTKPFETIGAPWIDAEMWSDELCSLGLPGVIFRPSHFTPTFSKHAGTPCHGVQLHVTDRDAFEPVRTGLHLLASARSASEFCWLPAPAGRHRFIDLLMGSGAAAERLASDNVDDLLGDWLPDLAEFDRKAGPYLLYH